MGRCITGSHGALNVSLICAATEVLPHLALFGCSYRTSFDNLLDERPKSLGKTRLRIERRAKDRKRQEYISDVSAL